MMRLLFLVLTLLAVVPAHAGHSGPKIFLRIHVQTTGSGMAADQAQTVAVPPDGELIQVRALPEVTEGDLIGVEPRANGTLLTFDHSGQVNLDAVTGEDQGRILVVLLNGYVIYAPVIDEQISNGQLLLPHPLAPQIVKLLQEVAAKNVRDRSKA